MRKLCVLLHRWVGLASAAFIFVAALTGTVIAWEHELDVWLNPQLHCAAHATANPATHRTAVALAAQVERANPHLHVRFLPLAWAPGHTIMMGVEGRTDPVTGARDPLGFNQIFVDPNTGRVQARRDSKVWCWQRADVLPLLYRLHYSMLLPGSSGIWFMGALGALWTLDCFVAIYLAFPRLRLWRQSVRFRVRAGGARLLFDLHRSSGVWLWGLVLMMALTAVTLSLGSRLIKPALRGRVPMRAPLEAELPTPEHARPAAALPREEILARAALKAQSLGIEGRPGAVAYGRGVVRVGFFAPEEDPKGHGSGGLQPPWLAWDSRTGAFVGQLRPGFGSITDKFLDLQFPLHSGRLLGTPGRALISGLGLLIALLSATGVLVWARKRGKLARPKRAVRSNQKPGDLKV